MKATDWLIIGAVAVGGIYLLKQITGTNIAKDVGTATGEAVGGASGGLVTGIVKGTVDSGKDLGNYFTSPGWGTDLINFLTGNNGVPSTQRQGATLPDGTVIYHDFPTGTDETTISNWFLTHGVQSNKTTLPIQYQNNSATNPAVLATATTQGNTGTFAISTTPGQVLQTNVPYSQLSTSQQNYAGTHPGTVYADVINSNGISTSVVINPGTANTSYGGYSSAAAFNLNRPSGTKAWGK